MNLTIINHRLIEADYAPSPNVGDAFAAGRPDTIILHFTDMNSAAAAIARLRDPGTKVSAHLVIGRDGAVTQLVPFDRIAWHAGVSRHGERDGLNRYAIGIELDNAGRLRRRDDGYVAWTGEVYAPDDVALARHPAEAEPTYWHTFPPAQLETTRRVCLALIRAYPICWILGHDEVAPGRKCDPGPAFPMSEFRALTGSS